jgi:hypothetical protein
MALTDTRRQGQIPPKKRNKKMCAEDPSMFEGLPNTQKQEREKDRLPPKDQLYL